VERAETDLDRDGAAVLASAEQFEPDAHRSRPRLGRVTLPVGAVDWPQVVRDQHFDRLAEELLARVTKRQLGLPIDDGDCAVHVDDDDGVWRNLQQALEPRIRRAAAFERWPQLRHATIVKASDRSRLTERSSPGGLGTLRVDGEVG